MNIFFCPDADTIYITTCPLQLIRGSVNNAMRDDAGFDM